MITTLSLTEQLIRCRSITPQDAGCQKIIHEQLEKSGFKIEHLRFDDVDNLWARHGTHGPLVVFAGHTDVVPEGPIEHWTTDPFQPSTRDGFLYGRGASDMKSGLAALIVAAKNFIEKNPDYPGSIGFLITSDEEGISINGTKKVVEELVNRGEKIDYCLIGEASSDKLLGDQIRVGRRGSLHGKLTVYGKQGHIAYPHLAENPIHLIAGTLQTLTSTLWDSGNEFFPPTNFQISQIKAGTGANNVIPGILNIVFNFRFGTASTVDSLQKKVADILMKNALSFDLQWNLSCHPFISKQGKLVSVAKKAIHEYMKIEPRLSTGGGTSDGRFIAPLGTEVIELGPINKTVHQVNECVSIKDLERLTQIYERILELLFA